VPVSINLSGRALWQGMIDTANAEGLA